MISFTDHMNRLDRRAQIIARSNVETTTGFIELDPHQEWWIHWRINSMACGCSLVPAITADAVNIMEKAAAVYGRENVWLEKVDAEHRRKERECFENLDRACETDSEER